MIGLIDFLKTSGVGINVQKRKLKIHLACYNQKEYPLEVFYAGRFKEWQERQGQRNFSCEHVISLIDMSGGNWLFAGVYEILDCKPHPEFTGDFLYSTQILPQQEDLIGRIVIHHKRNGVRASYIWHKPDIALTVSEIRSKPLTIQEFPGYNAVVISHSNLKIITDQKIATWHGALANVNGIYLITDKTTGKHYVGKASGNEGIWQRWCAYAKDGHGGNVQLKRLLAQEGAQHMNHFQYSILEIADSHASDKDILNRESYWMEALKTRDFGMN